MKILIASLSIISFATAATASQPIGKVLAEGVTASDKLFYELVPLQRALFLKAIGVPLIQIPLIALHQEEGFRDTVMQSLLSDNSDSSPITNILSGQDKLEFIGTKEADPIYSTYLPATYNLSAEDVYFSFRDYHPPIYGVGAPARIIWMSFFLSDVENALALLLGHSGRRDILENMNKLDAETMQELVRKVSTAWVLWAQEIDSNSEMTQSLREIRELREPIDVKYKILPSVIAAAQSNKFHTEEGNRLSKEWKKIEAMDANSSERNKALGIFLHDYIAHYERSMAPKPSFIQEQADRMGEVGQALLDDLTIPTILAVDQLASILLKISPPPLFSTLKPDKKSFQDFLFESCLNILDKELQQTLADKEQH